MNVFVASLSLGAQGIYLTNLVDDGDGCSNNRNKIPSTLGGLA